MFRPVLEFLFTILIVMVARALLTSLLKGFANAGRNSRPNPAPDPPRQNQTRENQTRAGQQRSTAGELHKDPVCGTYVAESTSFRRQTGGQTFYYCSEACREKHSLVAR